MANLSALVKNAFFVLLLLIIAPQIISLLKEQYSQVFSPATKVGIISFKEMLSGSAEYVKNLKKFFKNDEIKAIVLRMDCPGGLAGTSQAIYYELKALKQQYPHKPVIVFVENVCASGAYYIASTADWIVATPSAFVGSIGVYIPQPHLKDFMESFKIGYSVTKSGEYKTMLNPLLSQSKEQDQLVQELCDDTYNQFVTDVATSRPQLVVTQAPDWANGKIFTGRQALNKKLIDQLGCFADIEIQVRQRAHIPDKDDIQWIKSEQRSPLMKFIAPDDVESSDSYSYADAFCNSCYAWFTKVCSMHA